MQLAATRKALRAQQARDGDKEEMLHRLEAKLALAGIEARQAARREEERVEVGHHIRHSSLDVVVSASVSMHDLSNKQLASTNLCHVC